MSVPDGSPRITAILGPTNTGKTYMAVERMLAHHSGIIGFPLRLLARENYDRVVRLVGPKAVALVTGEEKIVPSGARYFLCTVEAMPESQTDFLAVDEIQLAADPDRGHVFTDRLLHARGREETVFVGADTIRPLIRRLIPSVEFISRPRFSQLSYTGHKKLIRLPPRSAVVAFSVEDVYAMAELIRRRRGGTAVVMGALSPRTRNAQVALFQSGDVDYLVATDAIGMGLNMELSHVAFARRSKFDGRGMRRLSASELAQIAGRAGRYLRNGTFGTTGTLGPLDAETVEAIENHRFEPLQAIFWRNSDLDFRSIDTLIRSLERPSAHVDLLRARDADDHLALQALAADPAIARLARSPATVRLLWDVAQIPDFRKTMSDAHAVFLARVYRHLMEQAGRLPNDWVARNIDSLNRVDGDIEALTQRIASTRTWTFIAHRAEWLSDPLHWQERTRAIEDRLSDALHERLTERFVDRRTAALVRRMDRAGELLAAVRADGSVVVEGEAVGRLEAFRFVPDATGEDARPILQAAHRALRTSMLHHVERFERDEDGALSLDTSGRILWRDRPVARLSRGESILRPIVKQMRTDLLDQPLKARVQRRLEAWVDAHIARVLGPIVRLRTADLGGPIRGLVFQLAENLGCLARRRVADLVGGLTRAELSEWGRLGLRVGPMAVEVFGLSSPEPMRLRGLLWAVHHSRADSPPRPDAVSVADACGWPDAFFEAIGFLRAGPRLVRVDCLDRLAATARKRAAQGPFLPTPQMARLIGCKADELGPVLGALGYVAVETAEGLVFKAAGTGRNRRDARQGEQPGKSGGQAPPGTASRRKGRKRIKAARRTTYDPNSPFAKLRELKLVR
ncbi:MAG: helicase-related protein [Alphaproteobacteria bacterium]